MKKLLAGLLAGSMVLSGAAFALDCNKVDWDNITGPSSTWNAVQGTKLAKKLVHNAHISGPINNFSLNDESGAPTGVTGSCQANGHFTIHGHLGNYDAVADGKPNDYSISFDGGLLLGSVKIQQSV